MCRLYGFRANEPTKVECTLVYAQNAHTAMEEYRSCTATAITESREAFCACVDKVNCFFHAHAHCSIGPQPYVQQVQHGHECALFGPCMATA